METIPSAKSNSLSVVYKRPKILEIEFQFNRNDFMNQLEKVIDSLIETRNDVNDTNNTPSLASNINIDYYTSIYNQLYILSNKNMNEFKNIHTEISELVKLKIEKLLGELNEINPCANRNDNYKQEKFIVKFIEIYKSIENLVDNLKSLLTNHCTRFHKDLIIKMNSLSLKVIFNEYLSKTPFILDTIQTYIINCDKSNFYSTNNNNFIQKVIKFLQYINAISILENIIEFEKNRISKEFSALEKNFEEGDGDGDPSSRNLLEYLVITDNKIKNICFNFKILFGEKHSFFLSENLTNLMFLNKIPKILGNKTILDSLISSRDFTILSIIYKILNKKTSSLVIFQEKFFEIFVDRFNSDINIKTNSSVKEGLIYIDLLLERINILNEIFENTFAKDRRIQLRYKETLSRMINNKNVKNIFMLCAVYINEVMSRNVGDLVKIQTLLGNFSQILYAIDDVDNFFLTVQKFVIKRLSNLKYIHKNEIYLTDYLRGIFGARYCFGLYRIIKDIEQSFKMFEDDKELIKLGSISVNKSGIETQNDQLINLINILSYNVIGQNDLLCIINFSTLDHIFKCITEKYQHTYSHRKLTFSQNLSTCIVMFKTKTRKIELLVNLVQASILRIINQGVNYNSKTDISLEELIRVLDVKNLPVFRQNVMSLIQVGILLVKNDKSDKKITDLLNTDILLPNLNYVSQSLFTNLTNFIELSSQYIRARDNESTSNLSLNRHTSQSDIQSIENSLESQSVIYNANKAYIIDSRIIKTLKMMNGVEHNALVKSLIVQSKTLFGESGVPDLSVIQKRIDNLIDRSMIGRKIDDGKIIYNFAT